MRQKKLKRKTQQYVAWTATHTTAKLLKTHNFWTNRGKGVTSSGRGAPHPLPIGLFNFFSKLNLFLYKDALYGFVVILSKLLLTLYELVSNTQFKYQLRVPVHILQPFNKDSR